MNPPHNNSLRYLLRHISSPEVLRCIQLCKIVLFMFLVQPAQVTAGTSNADIPASSSTTVEELLRLDSLAALEVARRQVFSVVPGDSGSAISNHLPELVAIYGTGRNLSAELLISGRTVIYHGSAKQTVSGVTQGYTLDRIAPPCVYLTKNQSQQIACLESHSP